MSSDVQVVSPRCPRCGGRLFRESDVRGNRLFYFWECSLGCSRRWDLELKPMIYAPMEDSRGRVRRVVREPVLTV